jgi:regulation of enolase protein 1 (concanavalin A-like superfamily)
MDWLNEPPAWREEDGVLTVTTGLKTDFWRETHYGFVRDDGHFATAPLRGTSAPRWSSAGITRNSTTRPG